MPPVSHADDVVRQMVTAMWPSVSWRVWINQATMELFVEGVTSSTPQGRVHRRIFSTPYDMATMVLELYELADDILGVTQTLSVGSGAPPPHIHQQQGPFTNHHREMVVRRVDVLQSELQQRYQHLPVEIILNYTESKGLHLQPSIDIVVMEVPRPLPLAFLLNERMRLTVDLLSHYEEVRDEILSLLFPILEGDDDID